MKALNLVAAVALSVSGIAFAESPSDIITMHSEVIDTPIDAFAMIDRLDVNPAVSTFAEETVDIDQIMNLGQKAWDIIKANKPVGVTNSGSLAGFSNLQSSSVRMWGTNGFGMTVYDVTLTAVHQFGGNFNGKGNYLETVSIIPSNLSVLWGYTVNYGVDNVSALNGGTTENPIAMVSLQAKFKVETVLKHSETNTVYQFRGDSAKVMTSGI